MVATLAAVLCITLSLAAFVAVAMLCFPSPAFASPSPLSLIVDRPLSAMDESLTLRVEGEMTRSLDGDDLVLHVRGPAGQSQVGQSGLRLPEAAKIVATLGATAATGSDVAETVGVDLIADPASGMLRAEISLADTILTEPGAYLLVVQLESLGEVSASGQTWVGKAEVRDEPLDLAFIWPVSLGIHRDTDGHFFDRCLDEAVGQNAEDIGDLGGLVALSSLFPDWEFSLAPEPVLLTQLRDMADGYVSVSESGDEEEISANDPPALYAAEILAGFAALHGDQSVEVVAGPYCSADLSALASEGWRDGLQQILMGKQEIQQTLGLQTPPNGARSPDLDLTSDAVFYYAEASIDHVVVDAGLRDLLAEPVAEGTVAVRARNSANSRVTLVFADTELSHHMSYPWDAGVFSAALAAKLAAGETSALVLTPAVEFELIPREYLESIGEILDGSAWIRTLTLSGLLRAHGPDTRPVLLMPSTGNSGGYIEDSLLSAVKVAHAAVSDLGAVADTVHAPVEDAHRLLYMAQSRWWWRAETSPREASIGMDYAEEARSLAQQELEKIRLLGGGSKTIMGAEGTVDVILQNGAEYPVTVEVELAAQGMHLLQGSSVELELGPGRTEIQVPLAGGEGSQRLEVALVVGASVLGETGYDLRFVTIMTVLPWIVVAALVLVAGLALLIYRSVRKRRTRRAA